MAEEDSLGQPKLVAENSDGEFWVGIQPNEQQMKTSSLSARWPRFFQPGFPGGLNSGEDPGPPPDGGLKAWVQVGMAHLIIFNTWGFVNSFGVFQVRSRLSFGPLAYPVA